MGLAWGIVTVVFYLSFCLFVFAALLYFSFVSGIFITGEAFHCDFSLRRDLEVSICFIFPCLCWEFFGSSSEEDSIVEVSFFPFHVYMGSGG